jgi:hypothetical protein
MAANRQRELENLIDTFNDKVIEDKITRAAIQTTHVGLVDRIFSQGRDANGKDLGEYSESYYQFRRKKYNRTNRDVNLQATGQMKNDFTPLKILGDGQYGSGFNNSANAEKSYAVESHYNTSIFELSDDEEKKLQENFEFELNKRLK